MRKLIQRILKWAAAGPEEGGTGEREQDGKGQPGTLQVVASLVVPSATAVVLFTLFNGSWEDLGVAAMVAAGAFSLGAALGFLFGIPRTLATGGQVHRVVVAGGGGGGGGGGGQDGPPPGGDALDGGQLRYAPNTNLEDISDWLTKILLGAGLVQLTAVASALGRLAERIATAFGATPGQHGAAWAFSLGLLVAFLVSGFLSGYLYTRLRLQASFALADDISQLKQQVKQEVIEQVDAQNKTDAEALAIAGRQLNPTDATPEPRELDAAIAAASDAARKQIFNLARDQRRANRTRGKAKMKLTIPVFQALIAADPEGHYFRNWGQLGFAQHDGGDHQEAVESLTHAIELREQSGESGYRTFELVRALACIATGDTTGQVEQIKADLRTAATSPSLLKRMRADADVAAWCESQGVTLDDVLAPPAA